MADDNLTIVRRVFEEAFNQGNLDVVEELVDPDVIDHSTLKAPAPGGKGFKLRIAGLRQAFPDAHIAIENLFADGDMVAFTWTITGTQHGALGGIAATGKPVSVTGVNIERIAGGRIAEHWSGPDNLGMFQQLGVVPPLGPPPKSG